MRVRLFFVVVLVAVLLAGFLVPAEADSCPPVYHVVRPGQNLTQISRMYGVSVQAIVQANNLWNPNLIYPGQHLLIPGQCTQPPPPPPGGCTVIHIVKRGEYLKQIAARYHTTVNAIVRANHIQNPNLIYPGQRLKIPVRCQGPAPTPAPTGNWTGQYWPNRYLSGNPKFTRTTDNIDFNWGTQGPGGGIGGTNYSVRWNRTRSFDPGTYRFHILVDDGARVWVDNVLIIDQWKDGAVREFTADRQLSAGNHTLQVDYYQNQGTSRVKFWPELIGGQAPWKAEFFNNTDLSGTPPVVKSYSVIDFDWGTKAPEPGITADYFSARFTGTFNFVGGKYRFTATSDDGIRIYLDDNLILNEWHGTAARTYTVDLDVGSGNHKLKVEYFEEKGAAVCKLKWVQR